MASSFLRGFRATHPYREQGRTLAETFPLRYAAIRAERADQERQRFAQQRADVPADTR